MDCTSPNFTKFVFESCLSVHGSHFQLREIDLTSNVTFALRTIEDMVTLFPNLQKVTHKNNIAGQSLLELLAVFSQLRLLRILDLKYAQIAIDEAIDLDRFSNLLKKFWALIEVELTITGKFEKLYQ